MGISRLVYGRSAMQGLYLNPDAWYDERAITTLAEHARAAHRPRGARRRARDRRAAGVRPADPRDRLAAASCRRSRASASPGTACCATADDAIAICAPTPSAPGAPRGRRGRWAARARGRVRAAQARLRVDRARALDRLLRRQLDARAARSCASYLEGLGLEIVIGRRGRVGRRQRARSSGVDLERRPHGSPRNPARRRRHQPERRARRATPGCASGRGVLVDDRMRTDDPAVFAAGDVAEFAARSRAVADRGRAGGGRGRQRRRAATRHTRAPCRSRSSRSSASS